MVGYIRPMASELRLREYQYFRGVYCGLCRAQGRCTGQCSRMTLSYDFVFLTLLRLALTGGNRQADGTVVPIRFEKRRCLAHPIRPRPSLEKGTVSEDVARAAAALSLYRVLDDRADERGWRRHRAALLLPLLKHAAKRAERQDAGLLSMVEAQMVQFTQAEQQGDGIASADRPADAFGQVLAQLFARGLPDGAARIAHHIGKHVGRWMYLLDAADDYEQDVARGRCNPLYALYGGACLTQGQRSDLHAALLLELKAISDGLDLIDCDEDRCGRELPALLSHMVEVAMPQVTRQVLFPTDKTKKAKKASKDDLGLDINDGGLE